MQVDTASGPNGTRVLIEKPRDTRADVARQWLAQLEQETFNCAPFGTEALAVAITPDPQLTEHMAFTALGVLAQMHYGRWQSNEAGQVRLIAGYDENDTPNEFYHLHLPPKLQAKVGLFTPEGWRRREVGGDPKEARSIAIMSFRGMTHPQIAAEITRKPHLFFDWAHKELSAA